MQTQKVKVAYEVSDNFHTIHVLPTDDNFACDDILSMMSRIIILLVVISVFRVPISSFGCSLAHQAEHSVDPCDFDIALHNSNSTHPHLTDIVDSISSDLYAISILFVGLVSFIRMNKRYGNKISPPTPPPKYA